jgi:hypothetical protein
MRTAGYNQAHLRQVKGHENISEVRCFQTPVTHAAEAVITPAKHPGAL